MENAPLKLNKRQKEILKALLNKFEKSKTYRGENVVNQSFQVKPKDFFKEYDSDFADLDEQEDFERELSALEAEGLILLARKSGVVKTISMNVSAQESYYAILGRTELKELENAQIAMYESYLGKNALLDAFCNAQIGRLRDRKKAEYPEDEAREIIKVLEYICSNKEEILERELSIELFSNSKTFEKEYRKKVITVLKKYGDYRDIIDNVPDDREQEHALLAEHNILANPTYVSFKGNGKILLKNGKILELSAEMPLAIDSDTLNQIDNVNVLSKRIVTVENLTSFNRVKADNVFFIYLAGYHNSIKQVFIQKIAEDNPNKEWFHFGDIDPDGFYILEHLRQKTRIAFKPLYMSVEELKKYKDYCKSLEENDKKKARSLITKGLFVDEMQYILENNVKLEQEVVSWKQFIVI